MKKNTSVKFLAAVAIVTSATVLQIREHGQSNDAPSTNAATTMSSCSSTRDGLTPARCEPTRGERQLDRATQQHGHGTRQIWV